MAAKQRTQRRPQRTLVPHRLEFPQLDVDVVVVLHVLLFQRPPDSVCVGAEAVPEVGADAFLLAVRGRADRM